LNKSPNSLRAFGAFLLLTCAAVPVHSEQLQSGPFLTRDQNPFSMVYGQPLPTGTRLPGLGRATYAVALDITNTLNLNESADETLLLDFESYALTTSFSYSPAENWALKINIPLIYRGSGFLDHTIDNWHTRFGLPRASRAEIADDQLGIVHTSNGLTDVDIGASTSGIGDTQLSLGHQLVASDDSAVSVWAAVDLPTGDKDMLTGNGAVDYSVWIATENRLNAKWFVDANAGVVLPGNSVIASAQTHDAVAFGHAGLRWTIHPVVDLKFQLAAHSAYYKDTSMKMLGRSYILVFGGTVRLGRCSALDIGVSEDIKVGAAPDVSFLASWVSSFGDCATDSK
jgi:hypothetical protein